MVTQCGLLHRQSGAQWHRPCSGSWARGQRVHWAPAESRQPVLQPRRHVFVLGPAACEASPQSSPTEWPMRSCSGWLLWENRQRLPPAACSDATCRSLCRLPSCLRATLSCKACAAIWCWPLPVYIIQHTQSPCPTGCFCHVQVNLSLTASSCQWAPTSAAWRPICNRSGITSATWPTIVQRLLLSLTWTLVTRGQQSLSDLAAAGALAVWGLPTQMACYHPEQDSLDPSNGVPRGCEGTSQAIYKAPFHSRGET